eukprot:m.190455 g.190455  ORF g.190455 m.190455 type:complete len:94 (-) comp24887_c0_seq3:1248-1529(-)
MVCGQGDCGSGHTNRSALPVSFRNPTKYNLDRCCGAHAHAFSTRVNTVYLHGTESPRETVALHAHSPLHTIRFLPAYEQRGHNVGQRTEAAWR